MAQKWLPAFLVSLILLQLSIPGFCESGKREKSASSFNKDVRTLKSWVEQLNKQSGLLWDYQGAKDKQWAATKMIRRLVYGIDSLLDKFDEQDLTEDQRRVVNEAFKPKPQALGMYRQTSLRYRKQLNERGKEKEILGFLNKQRAELLIQRNLKLLRSPRKPDGPSQKEVPLKAGCLTDEAKTYPVSYDDLAFGQLMVLAMVEDIPDLKKYLKEQDPLWNWCTRQYAGQFTGYRYYWASGEIAPELVGVYRAHDESKKGIVALNTSHPDCHGEKALAEVIYQLLNIRNGRSYVAWRKHFGFGKMSKSEFNKQRLILEYFTTRKLAKFFVDVWKPRAKKLGIDTSPDNWKVNTPKTFAQWRESNDPIIKLIEGR